MDELAVLDSSRRAPPLDQLAPALLQECGLKE